MRSRFVSLSVIAMTSALVCGFACTSPAPQGTSRAEPSAAASGEPVGRVRSPIVNGALDQEHDAVMAILSFGDDGASLCSGTMIRVDAERHIGWILTAAHCVASTPGIVLQGPDYGATTALRYLVLDWAYDRRYDQGGDAGQRNDIAVIRVLGVDENTPVIPMASSPDGLEPGSPLTAVGYGRTTLIAEGSSDTNTRRRQVELSVDAIDADLLTYDMGRRGICQGDSGGPDLMDTGDGERVVGVHSFVAGDCDGIGVSGRVTGNLAFIQGVLDEPLPERDCDLCQRIANSGTRECARITDACLQDEACAGVYDCPGLDTSAGREACFEQFPRAEGPLLASAACPCVQSCRDVCAGEAACRGVPRCGFILPAGDCRTCGEGACCQETIDCAADADCYACLARGATVAECDGGAPFRNLSSCVATRCSSCEGTTFDFGGVPAGGEPPGPGASSSDGCAFSPVSSPCRGASLTGLALALGLGVAAARRRSRVC